MFLPVKNRIWFDQSHGHVTNKSAHSKSLHHTYAASKTKLRNSNSKDRSRVGIVSVAILTIGKRSVFSILGMTIKKGLVCFCFWFPLRPRIKIIATISFAGLFRISIMSVLSIVLGYQDPVRSGGKSSRWSMLIRLLPDQPKLGNVLIRCVFLQTFA